MTEINQSPGPARFGLPACLIIWAGITVFGFYASTHMVAAGDTWVALACGRHHANHGVDVVEPFSFNSHKPGPTDEQLDGWPAWTHGLIRTIHPTGWINQNWLTHLTFYELVHLFGTEDNPNYNMLIVWKFALFIATAFVVYALGRVIGVNPLLAGIAACFAMIIGRSFFDIRPACWSNFFVPLYLLVLVLAVYRNIRYIWLLIRWWLSGQFPRRLHLRLYDDGALLRTACGLADEQNPPPHHPVQTDSDHRLCGHCVLYRDGSFQSVSPDQPDAHFRNQCQQTRRILA
jgi:hypothetical protein